MPWTHRGQQTWEWMYEPGHRLGHRGLMFGQRVGNRSCSLASQTVCICGWWRHLRPKWEGKITGCLRETEQGGGLRSSL